MREPGLLVSEWEAVAAGSAWRTQNIKEQQASVSYSEQILLTHKTDGFKTVVLTTSRP